MFLLKAHRGDKYNPPERHELTGKGGEPLETKATITVDTSQFTDDELYALAGIAGRIGKDQPGTAEA